MLSTPSSNCMGKIKDLLYKCIWNNKRDNIKRKVMNQDYTLGGCKMIDITVQNKALKLLWIPCIFENNDSFWVQCLQANTHSPLNTYVLAIKQKDMENVWVII